jgi:WD40 repeat protein
VIRSAPSRSPPTAARSFDDTRTPTGLEIWDTARGVRLARHAPAPQVLAFAPDGTSIASGAGLIDAASGPIGGTALPADLSMTAVAYRADGRQLAFDDIGDHLRLWDVGPWRLRAALSAPATGNPWPATVDRSATTLAFAQDGSMLAAAHDTGVELWNLADGQPLGLPIPVPDTGIRAIAFSADDRHLTVAGTQAVHTVPVGPPALIPLLCQRAGRDLTGDEWTSYLPGHRPRRLC